MSRGLAALLLLIVLLAAGCGEQHDGDSARAASRPAVHAEVFAYRTNKGGGQLELLVGRAGSDRIVRATQHSDSNRVSVEVVVRSNPNGRDLSLVQECIAVRLDEPLAGRQVLNSDTGRSLRRAKRGSEEAALLRRKCAQRD